MQAAVTRRHRIHVWLICFAACGGGPLVLNSNLESSAKWAAVVREPRSATMSPPLSHHVRSALVTRRRVETDRRPPVKHWVEIRHVMRFLATILERTDDSELEALSRFLSLRLIVSETSVRDVVSEIWRQVDRLIRIDVAARAYTSVVYANAQRAPSRRELAFVALELTAYWLGDLVADESKSSAAPSERPPTAGFAPTLLPYLAVAVGVPASDVRRQVEALLADLAP